MPWLSVNPFQNATSRGQVRVLRYAPREVVLEIEYRGTGVPPRRPKVFTPAGVPISTDEISPLYRD